MTVQSHLWRAGRAGPSDDPGNCARGTARDPSRHNTPPRLRHCHDPGAGGDVSVGDRCCRRILAVLDDPVGVSSAGQHAHLARRCGRVSAYLPDVASFCSLPLNPRQEDWADAATLLGPGGLVDLFTAQARPPAGLGSSLQPRRRADDQARETLELPRWPRTHRRARR